MSTAHPLLVNVYCFSTLVLILILMLILPTFTTLHVVMLAAAGDLSSDKQALLDFAAAVPHSRSRKLNWNTNSSLCTTWAGVTCSSANRVVQLRLPAAGFYGSIPLNTLGRLDALSSLSLRSNRFYGSLPSDVLSLPSIRHLYFQDNNFSGNIPSNLSQQLTFLDLSFNSLTGDIPTAINNLTRLVTFNLQNNSLSGPLPDLPALSTLQQLNLSNNNFNGSIPHSLQRFSASSFQGNSLLCGNPLPQCPSLVAPSPSPSPAPTPLPAHSPPFFVKSPPASLPSSPAPAASSHKGNSKSKLTTASAVGIAVASSAVLLLLFLFCWVLRRTKKRGASRDDGTGTSSSKSKTTFGRNDKYEAFGRNRNGVGVPVLEDEKEKLVFLQGVDHFDLDHLLRAPAEVLGKGTYGTTYKANLEEGTTVAVKRLKLKQVGVSKMVFEQHMENVGRVNHHPNVIPLRAYYYSKDEKLLVYDYAPFGNLSTVLHGNRGYGGRALDWESRLKICLGAARGVAHIHSATGGGGRLIHGNIKSSNVVLARDLTGCISDFGITPLVGCRKTGYQAPEVREIGKYTQKSDVYSFGVMLLEVLTGKAPIQSAAAVEVEEEEVDLPTWAYSAVREEWTAEVFDGELNQNENEDAQEEKVQMLQIALACAARLPETRPNMEQVVKMIQQVVQPVFEN